MSTAVQSQLAGVRLAWRSELQLRDRQSAMRALRTMAAEGAGGMAALRRLLAEGPLGLNVNLLDDSAVLEQLASRIESGRLVLLRQSRVAGNWSERTASAPPPTPAEPVLAAPMELTWVEIQLLDEANEPVAGQRYEIRLPDNSVHAGKLDYRGKARVSDVATPGACMIRFPDLDSDAWERIE